MLIILLAESALELIPVELAKEREVVNDGQKRRKKWQEILLDSSKHQHAIRKLKNFEKRGRPDLIHFALLMALDSGLNSHDQLKIFVHTIDNKLLSFDQELRLPRIYNRFCGTMEDLLVHKEIQANRKMLMKVEDKTLQESIDFLKEQFSLDDKSFTVMDPNGKATSLKTFRENFETNENKCVIIGGFAHGKYDFHFPKTFEKISICDKELSVWNIVAATIFAFEEATE